MQRGAPVSSSLNSQGGNFPPEFPPVILNILNARNEQPDYSYNKIIFLPQFYTVKFVKKLFINIILQIMLITPCELAFN